MEQVDGYEAIEDNEEYEEMKEEVEVEEYEEVKEVDGYEVMEEVEVDGYEVMEEVEVEEYEEVKEVEEYEVMEEVEVDGYEVMDEVEVDEYEEVKEVEEYEVMDGDEAEISTNPGVKEEENDPGEYMDMSGNDPLPPPVVTSQEPPNQTIQQTPSGGECEVRTSDGGGSSQTADESQSYVNVDPDASPSLPLTKNPVCNLPPVAMLPPDHVNHEGTQL